MPDLDIASATTGQPFTAGVAILLDGSLVFTLNDDPPPAGVGDGDGDGAWLRLGGVGGGQEPGETIWACARREAREELGVEVTLVDASTTWYRDWTDGVVRLVTCTDEIAPVLFERRARPDPLKPYKPGLPTGPFHYNAIFLGRADGEGTPRPCSEVRALLLVPAGECGALAERPSLRRLGELGATWMAEPALDEDTRLWLPEHEGVVWVAQALAGHPELTRQIG